VVVAVEEPKLLSLKKSVVEAVGANLVRVFVRRRILRHGRVEGARADPLRLSVLVFKACPSNPRISGGAPAGLASSASACDDGKGAEAALS